MNYDNMKSLVSSIDGFQQFFPVAISNIL